MAEIQYNNVWLWMCNGWDPHIASGEQPWLTRLCWIFMCIIYGITTAKFWLKCFQNSLICMQYILKLNPFCYLAETTVSSLYMAQGGSMYAT